MFYQEQPPPEQLRPYILSFWEFRGPDPGSPPAEHRIFPDGCVSLFFYRSSLSGVRHVGVTPLFTEAVVRAAQPGDITWGMRISPAAGRLLLGTSPAAFRSSLSTRPFEARHMTDGLDEKLAGVSHFDEAVAVFTEKIAAVAASAGDADQKVATAVDAICAAGGNIRVTDLAETVGLGVRQLQRRFARSGGISPKEFARIRRIRAAAYVLVEDGSVNWADRALEMGFADQSHLTNEFNAVTGHSPGRFAREVRSIEHGEMVE